ncbi:MAG: hypothetical protein R3C03_15320 [Pirellulaceae bacterium]
MLGEGSICFRRIAGLVETGWVDTPYKRLLKPDETFRFDWSNPVLNTDASDEEWGLVRATRGDRSESPATAAFIRFFTSLNEGAARSFDSIGQPRDDD